MRSAALFVVAIGVFACGESAPRQVRIEPIARSSCGWSPVLYDISCVQSLQVSVHSGGREVVPACTTLAGRFANVQELLGSEQVLEVVTSIAALPDTVVELRAYHTFNRAPCTDLSDSELMMWGSSDPVDLSDKTLEVIPVHIECRPDCGCEGFQSRPGECPISLTPGICSPQTEIQCRKRCETTASCYDGLLPCVASSCDEGGSSMCCEALPREICSHCVASTDCVSGQCAHNDVTNEDFCAPRCPPLSGALPCPWGMSCKRLSPPLSAL